MSERREAIQAALSKVKDCPLDSDARREAATQLGMTLEQFNDLPVRKPMRDCPLPDDIRLEAARDFGMTLDRFNSQEWWDRPTDRGTPHQCDVCTAVTEIRDEPIIAIEDDSFHRHLGAEKAPAMEVCYLCDSCWERMTSFYRSACAQLDPSRRPRDVKAMLWAFRTVMSEAHYPDAMPPSDSSEDE